MMRSLVFYFLLSAIFLATPFSRKAAADNLRSGNCKPSLRTLIRAYVARSLKLSEQDLTDRTKQIKMRRVIVKYLTQVPEMRTETLSRLKEAVEVYAVDPGWGMDLYSDIEDNLYRAVKEKFEGELPPKTSVERPKPGTAILPRAQAAPPPQAEAAPNEEEPEPYVDPTPGEGTQLAGVPHKKGDEDMQGQIEDLTRTLDWKLLTDVEKIQFRVKLKELRELRERQSRLEGSSGEKKYSDWNAWTVSEEALNQQIKELQIELLDLLFDFDLRKALTLKAPELTNKEKRVFNGFNWNLLGPVPDGKSNPLEVALEHALARIPERDRAPFVKELDRLLLEITQTARSLEVEREKGFYASKSKLENLERELAENQAKLKLWRRRVSAAGRRHRE